MRKYLVLALALVLTFGIGSIAWGVEGTVDQTVTITVNEVAEIAVTGDVALTIAAPTTPGDIPAGGTDDTTYAQYTSVVPSGETRNITAAVTNGTIPAGCTLTLKATSVPTDCGTAATEALTLSSTAGSIITAIGSCATGTEGGAQLTYTLAVSNVAELVATSEPASVTVTLTLTEAA